MLQLSYNVVNSSTPRAVVTSDPHMPSIKQEDQGELGFDHQENSIAKRLQATTTEHSDSDWLPTSPVTLTSVKRPRRPSRKRSNKAARVEYKSKWKSTSHKGIATTLNRMKGYPVSLRKARQCILCDRKYRFLSLLHLHMKQHQAQASYTLAKQTLKRYISASQCYRNLKVPHGCKACKSDFSLYSLYQRHYHRRHSLCLRCASCPSHFLTVFAYQRHLQSKHGRKFHWTTPAISRCPHCLKVFLHHANLARHTAVAHTQASHSPRKQVMVCRICQKQYVSIKPFEKHLASHGQPQQEVEKEVLMATGA